MYINIYLLNVYYTYMAQKTSKTNHVIPTLHLLWRQRKGPLCQVRRQRLPEGPCSHRGDPAEGLGLTLVEDMGGFCHVFTIVLLGFTMVLPWFSHVFPCFSMFFPCFSMFFPCFFTMFKHVRPNPDVAPHLQSS